MTDLVIGKHHSRFAPARILLVTAALVVVLAALSLLAYKHLVAYPSPSVSIDNSPLTSHQHHNRATLSYSKSTLEFVGAVRVLRSAGTPSEVGAARGRLLAASIKQALHPIHSTVEEAFPATGIMDRLFHTITMRWNLHHLDNSIPAHHLVELFAMSKAAELSHQTIDYEALVRSAAAFDIGHPLPSSRGHDHYSLTRSLTAIATFSDFSGDHILLGHQLSLDGITPARPPPLLTFVRPNDAIAYATIGWAGQPGTLTGVNAKGIAVLAHPSRSADVRVEQSAPPISIVVADILASAQNLEQATSTLRKNKPLGTAVFVIASGATRSALAIERSPSRIEVIKLKSGSVVTDILSSKGFANDSENDRRQRRRPTKEQKSRLLQLLHKTPPRTIPDLVKAMRDHKTAAGQILPMGHRAAVADYFAQHTILVDPASMVLWINDGPGPAGRFRAFDLRYELVSNEHKPAPPLDIQASSELDRVAIARLYDAQKLLSQAHQAQLANKLQQAQELTDQALIRMPNYPRAVLEAASIAGKQGHRERSHALYRRYLKLGADNSVVQEQIQAELGSP